MTKRRWVSIWIQLDEISRLTPNSVLEIGPGLGVLKTLGSLYDLNVTTVDNNPELNADYIGSIDSLPFVTESFDLVCAFQVLEHLPFSNLPASLRELSRVTSRWVLMSLPNAQITWRYCLYLPKLGEVKAMIQRPGWNAKEHTYDGEHYWEINKKGYPLKKIEALISEHFKLLKSWRTWENPYHHFFLLEKYGK